MRNDARNQNDIDGPVTHGLICDIDLATDRVSRGRQYEITHWPRAPLVQSSASARKNGVNLRSVPIGSQNHGEIIQAAAYRGIGRGNTPKYWTGVSIQGPFWVKTGNTQREQMTSALPLRADIAQQTRHVRFVPKRDIALLAASAQVPVRDL